MAKKKFYAVKVGKKPGIYNTWNECAEQVQGVSGAVYRGFVTLDEAETFLSDFDNEKAVLEERIIIEDEFSVEKFNLMVENRRAELKEDEVIAFVDGSYDATEEKSAFGAIMISHGKNKDILYKAFTKNLGEDFIDQRNVAAELEGVKEAINWSIIYNKKKLIVFYDYEGIDKNLRDEHHSNDDKQHPMPPSFRKQTKSFCHQPMPGQ